jgi:hypothetical protein
MARGTRRSFGVVEDEEKFRRCCSGEEVRSEYRVRELESERARCWILIQRRSVELRCGSDTPSTVPLRFFIQLPLEMKRKQDSSSPCILYPLHNDRLSKGTTT